MFIRTASKSKHWAWYNKKEQYKNCQMLNVKDRGNKEAFLKANKNGLDTLGTNFK